MFDLLGSGANSQQNGFDSGSSNNFETPFDFAFEEDSALMAEQMELGTTAASRCGGNKGNLATPPLQNGGCGQNCEEKGNVATPIPVQNEEVEEKGNVATPPFQAENPDIDDITDASIKEILDTEGEFTFEFNGNTFTLRLGDDGKYKAFDANNNVVDGEVRIQDNFTVEGFVEVGGLSGLEGGNRLYIGVDPETGELAFIEATAELDANDAEIDGRTHLETLLETGEQHDVLLGNKGNVGTPPFIPDSSSDEQKADQVTSNTEPQLTVLEQYYSNSSSDSSEPSVIERFFSSTSSIDMSSISGIFGRIFGVGGNDSVD